MSYYPKYQKVIDYIMHKINNNELSSGDKIPSEKELAELHGVSNITIRKAMSELVASGIIHRIRGKGSFVSDSPAYGDKKQHRLVAFLFPGFSLNGSAYMQYIVSMQRYFLSHGFSLIIESTDTNKTDELTIVRKLIDKNVKGFLFFSKNPEKSIPCYQILDEQDIPFVLIDRYTPLYPSNYVGCNNHDGIFTAVKYLLNQNHTGIAYIAMDMNLSSEKDRYSGYKDAFISAGLSVNRNYLFSMRDTEYERLLNHIREGDITAIVTANDKTAIEVIRLLNQEGLGIPEDVSIIGFDDSDILEEAMIPLTTVKQYFDEIGYQAAKLLGESIDQNRPCNHIELGTRLIVRKSTKEKQR